VSGLIIADLLHAPIDLLVRLSATWSET